MEKQIKQRIEQINNGQVPEGYFRTTAGIIPQEWRISPLGSLLEFKNGVNADKEKYGSGIKMISVMDVLKNTPIHYNDIIGQVDIDENTLNTYCVNYGDILFQRSSETAEDAGKSNVYLDNEKTTYSGFVIRGKKKADYCPYFLNEALKKEEVRKQLIRNAAGSQHINIGQESLEKIEVCLPSATEQEKIAEILMKWDKAIELQEKYIEKLAEKRKYIFHSLFLKNDNWTCKKLQNVINVLSGYAFKSETYVEDGKYLIITIANVNDNRFAIDKNTKKVNSIPKDIREYQKLQINDIIMSLTGNVARICKVSSKNCLLNQRVAKIEVKKEYDKDFVFYLLQTFKFSEYMKMYAQGAAQDNLSVKDIYRFQVYLPKTIEEQNAISKKLSTYDLILKNEDKKLNLLKQQRKALQQYLLNGIVRVEV